LELSVKSKGEWIASSKPLKYSTFRKNIFDLTINKDQENIKLTLLRHIPNAMASIEPFAGGIPVAEIIFSCQEGREKIILRKGQTVVAGNLRLTFEPKELQEADIFIFQQENRLIFKSNHPVEHSTMVDQSFERLPADSLHPFLPRHLYNFNGNAIVLISFLPQARITASVDPQDEFYEGRDACWVRVETKQKHIDILVWKSIDGSSGAETFSLDENLMKIFFGAQKVKLPFSLYLKDFYVERYPGSNSPSGYESKVVLTDSVHNLREDRRIFMNNVLKYRGFRFYQSSYDEDEKGTVLSVNHDPAGTMVTYAGYLLMALGMVLSLLNRNSRFRRLARETAKISRSKDMLVLIILLTAIPIVVEAREDDTVRNLIPVSASHAEKFGKILVQDIDGRIEPLNTLSSQLLRKLYRKNIYKNMNADQVFLGMLIDPAVWQHEPLIRARHPQIHEIMGSESKYFSFASFFSGSDYILRPYVETAYRKKPAYRSKLENEIIRLDERVNIAYLLFTGEMLRIFPVDGDSTYTWYTPSQANGFFNHEDSVSIRHFMSLYSEACKNSLLSGNWSEPNRILEKLKRYQYNTGLPVIPQKGKINTELILNKYDIFNRLSNYYGIIGFVLLLYQFVSLFNKHIRNRWPVIIAISLIVVFFILHTGGLIMRWYVSGHAPWSNGYEALVFIAWAAVLAGIVFVRRSGLTLSVTSVLASLILHIAHLSWMDPQITNLVPVLKSYWLIIHVATITTSYGFLALGALLASVNLLVMVFQNRFNYMSIELTIKQLTCIIEMTLITGLYFLAVGTFLGAVWANESWGRYWGWDPKETWALATIIVYAFIVHMRLVPGLKGRFSFNLAALLGLGSVIMTYFGVNYYLSGLHSYAKGDPLPVPVFVYFALGIIVLVAILASINQRRLHKKDILRQ
ncbi:MAG: cytochrome c biogenesis protein CcsA, partial [Bacteroidales bacterium]|nr:cytochrome c biogenesis protein CcsA [Bacteroidales bacterium]